MWKESLASSEVVLGCWNEEGENYLSEFFIDKSLILFYFFNFKTRAMEKLWQSKYSMSTYV